jgi:dihydrofolate reductase
VSRVSIIVAQGSNRVIGSGGRLPWHLPSDLRRFRDLTRGNAVVMGRKTFESLPPAVRPLPDRRNLVISSNPDYVAPGAEVFGSLEAALEACARTCFVIGGSRVYAEAAPVADRVYLTDVDAGPPGDAFFPVLAEEEWSCVEQSERITENDHDFVFRVYDRTR